jgi:hypothetical protein
MKRVSHELTRRNIATVFGCTVLACFSNLRFLKGGEHSSRQASCAEDILITAFGKMIDEYPFGRACCRYASPVAPLLHTLNDIVIRCRNKNECDSRIEALVMEKVWDTVHKDFSNEEVMTIDGWILSVTEIGIYGFVGRKLGVSVSLSG